MHDSATGTRTQLWRMTEIHERVKAGGFPNCSTLAAELEVTPKTIQRDITHMRDFLNLPLEYDDKRHGYCYSRETDEVPLFEVGVGELTVLFLMRQALEPVRGTELEAGVWSLLSRITLGAEERVRFAWSDAERVFSRKPGGQAMIEAKVMGRLGDAVLRRKEVQFNYRKMGAKVAEKRRVQPYHLGEVDGCWYLIGRDRARGALRTFALPRIQGVKVMQSTFERPVDFEGREYLANSFGIWTNGAEQASAFDVRVELSDYAARLAEERRWHPSQQLKRLSDGRVEVRFQVSRLEDMLRWVLGWGAQARVISPDALVTAVDREIREMHARRRA